MVVLWYQIRLKAENFGGLSREVTIQSSSFSFQAMVMMVQGTNEKRKTKGRQENRMSIFGV